MSKSLQRRELYDFGGFRLDTGERALTRNGHSIPLTPKAFDTLVALLRNSGHVVEKDALLKEVWPDTFVEEGVLAVNVAAIRKALSEGEEGRTYIETIPRRGYRLNGQVSQIEAEPGGATSKGLPKGNPSFWGLAIAILGLGAIATGWYFSRSSRVIQTSAQPIPLTSYPGHERNPSFSPDGRQIAFTWNGPQKNNFDIYVKVIDRGEPLRLTSDPARDERPAWSPDGSKIAFVRDGTVFIISPLGGGERKVAAIQAGQIQWTLDSRSLVVSAGRWSECRLLLLSEETGETRELTSPAGKDFVFGDLGFSISPNADRLAIARFRTSAMAALFLMPLAGGTAQRLMPDEIHVAGVTWTNDGRELVYSSSVTSVQTLWRRSVEAGLDSPSQRVEGAGPGASEPVISRAASGSPARLAYVSSVVDSNIWVRDIGELSGEARQLIASTRHDGDPQFSPDGQRIAFASDRSGIRQVWIANSDGSNPVQLTFFPSGFTNGPRWSPDGSRLVFASIQDNNRDLFTIASDGSSLRRLTLTPSEEGRPSWSQSGRWIYCYSNRSGRQEVWKVPADGGEMIQVTTEGGHESFESPDGKLLYFEDYGVKGLQSLPTERSAAQQPAVVLRSVRPGYWAVAEKGIYFVEFDDYGAAPYRLGSWFWLHPPDDVANSPQMIKFYDFRTQKISQSGTIDAGVARGLPGFSVTRDGRYIAWSQIDHAESDLMMIENFR